MQLIKTMLVKSQLLFELDLNPMLNLLQNFLKELEKHNIIKQIGSSPQDKPLYGTIYLNPLIIILKGNTIKCVLDARHFNSNTEQSDESWPIEPLTPQLARANKKQTNLQLTLCTPTDMHLLTKALLNLPVSHQVINSLLS